MSGPIGIEMKHWFIKQAQSGAKFIETILQKSGWLFGVNESRRQVKLSENTKKINEENSEFNLTISQHVFKRC